MLGEEDQSRNPASGGAVPSAVFRRWGLLFAASEEIRPVIAGRLIEAVPASHKSIAKTRVRDHLPLLAARSNHNQSNAANQSDCAQDWRDRYRVLFFVLNLYRTEINIFLFMGKADSAHRESHDADDYQ